jgi:hypothetical protein
LGVVFAYRKTYAIKRSMQMELMVGMRMFWPLFVERKADPSAEGPSN